MQLPTQDVLETLQENSRNVLLLVRAFQIPFVRAMVANARPLRLPSEADRARDRAYRLRQEIRGYIERQPHTGSMSALSPLFDEYDPTIVAAALASQISLPEEPEGHTEEVPTWIRIRVDAGKRQRIRTGDLVGALLNAVEIPKNRVGKVDVRDGYSLVEVRAEVADKAVSGLNGLLLRGNKLTARPDRH
jgi:ATP-dependent RNA helicase DeaD